jgi:hypothetical protein
VSENVVVVYEDQPVLVITEVAESGLEVSAPAGPRGPTGPTGPAGSDGFVVSATPPADTAVVWIKPT